MPIPDRAPDSAIEDTESIETDIPTLFKLYAEPIDLLRSMSRPSVSSGANKSSDPNIAIVKSDFDNILVSNVRAMESRAHTFYRMLGFPVVGSDGSFYNPGFDPNSAGSFTKRQAVNGKISTSLQTVMTTRETNPDTLRQIFANQDVGSSTYALMLRYPIPFKVLADGVAPLDPDQQFFTVDDRSAVAALLTIQNPLLADSIGAVAGTVNGAKHILKPFTVDPRIENTVMPDANKICVPFLANKKTTLIAPNIYVQRPGLESIISQRLSDQSVDTNFLTDVSNIIAGATTPVTTISLDRETIIDTIEALATDNAISGDATDTFQNFSDIQIINVTRLIKTIKQVVKQLSKAMTTIDRAKQLINFMPVPSTDGPITGPNGAALSRSATSNALSDVDNKIVELRIKKLNAERQVVPQQDLGFFASPFAGSSGTDSVKVFNDQLQDLVSKRDGIAEEAFKAMRDIEMITGEISGLGLIDILAVYTALWAIDTETLINFLDDDAISRLFNFNPIYQGVPEVAARNGGTKKSMIDVLTTFEGKVSSILGFADKLLANQLLSPLVVFGGSTE
ncbi:MAG TPA: hypothetical protein VM577_08545 [Anaerovoracaceae bacterium]|nr:hypothetical protein [Anaerovoracaceae bacterium]